MNNHNLTPFKPGQSGNPNGRPKKIPEIDELLADVLGDGDEAKAILQALITKAKKGDVRAAEVIFDRAYGKAKQDINQRTTIQDDRPDISKLTDAELRTLTELKRKCGVSKT